MNGEFPVLFYGFLVGLVVFAIGIGLILWRVRLRRDAKGRFIPRVRKKV